MHYCACVTTPHTKVWCRYSTGAGTVDTAICKGGTVDGPNLPDQFPLIVRNAEANFQHPTHLRGLSWALAWLQCTCTRSARRCVRHVHGVYFSFSKLSLSSPCIYIVYTLMHSYIVSDPYCLLYYGPLFSAWYVGCWTA